MPDPKQQEILATIRELSQLSALTPARVSATFRCRLELLEEDAVQRRYLLVGGDLDSWGRIELRWLESDGRGILFADLAAGRCIPMEDTEAAFGVFPVYTTLPPDPRDPDSKEMHVYPVPAGELRLIFPRGEPPRRLHGFVVDPFPMVDWSEPSDRA